MFPYQSTIYLKQVALYVTDLPKALLFYRDVLGLSLMEEGEDHCLLGVAGEVLVELFLTTEETPVNTRYGLYHLALLVPSRQDLSDILKRLVDMNIPLVGGSDHGYSEAIYLEDFEGNGIEIYRDKPMTDWDIREDGRIIGVTEPLDGQELYQLARTLEPYQMPVGTRMGHVHLQVNNSREASQFYQTLLGLEDKFSMSTASWLAQGSYHHHIAVNEWGSKRQTTRRGQSRGLAYFVVQVSDEAELLALHERANQLSATTKWLNSKQLSVTDENGITVRLVVNR